jgi:hypothetical protein
MSSVAEQPLDNWAAPLVIHCQKGTGLVLIGQLLLALRHPENCGASAKVAFTFARDLARALLNDPALTIPDRLREEWERELLGLEARKR